ncbi:RNA polymerase sigma factor [Traorella massiliensis]|uniref:RNA polymerase sigma factor n=1 Tax=Traorella massiliensis TaxID=1903263 RepID=UPI0008F7FCAE|nr:sigma-70 family RNA polymerase sigma factor [Traorella massiliensis]
MAIPKRSYWLREVVTEEGTSYHISFRDGQGKIQKLCVSYDFYMAFRRLELDERKIEGWDYRHREFSEIMEETLNWRAVRQPKSIEEVILEEERAELLQKIIRNLPEMQRRRFLLHYEYEMTYKEIGKIEHCSQQSVGRAVTAAREKIKAEMKKYLNA